MTAEEKTAVIDISVAEKFKNPILALLFGLFVGAAVTWTAIHNIHHEQFTVLETSKQELERQLSEQKAENARLREQIPAVNPQKAAADRQRIREVETLIQRLDKEISKKKEELSRALIMIWDRNSPASQPPKSDRELRIEKELDALAAQRDQARKSSSN